jgi:hypothetical protein
MKILKTFRINDSSAHTKIPQYIEFLQGQL